MRLIPAMVAGLLLLTACSQGGTEAPAKGAGEAAVHPESGLKVVPLTVSGQGKTHRFRVELAQSRFEQAIGLMYRTKMGPDEGMLFPFDEPREASFWMKNTVLSLDIIFVGPDRRILNIAANTVPYSESKVLSDGLAGSVLELNAGRAAELGIAPGDKVDW